MRRRSRSRGWAVQLLYAWESRGGTQPPAALLEEFARERNISTANRTYLDELLRAVESHLPEIDAAIEACLTNWRLDRLSVIDRSILRLGAAEMMYLQVPPRVTIQEAILLAEKYGTAESPRFVNGVLDALMRRGGYAAGVPGPGEHS